MEKETSEIAKLTERISKDPKSKLFVPLAEEYKKAGDIEMAIHVLSEGLKNNPAYVTARSLLGRLLLETGDLEPARKELDEVVKAVPDNLLAQRKLGDIYILQEKRDEALQHYKTALSLNPGDKEFASLIADVEAGVDVRPRIQPKKAKPSPATGVKPSGAAAAPQQAKPAVSAPVRPAGAQRPREPEPQAQTVPKAPLEPVKPQTVERPAEKVQQEISAATAESKETVPPRREESRTPAVEAPALEQKPAKETLVLESEEPEEILAVEPLGEEKPAGEVEPAELEIPAEKGGIGIPGFISEEVVASAVPVEPEPTIFEPASERETVHPAAEEESAGLPSAEIAMEPTAREPEGAAEQADDFTTDTLAELYIAQGFYEKAISIYERMLADHPDSRGLQDKLTRVRAMAAQTEESPLPVEETAGAPEKHADADTDIFAEAKEYVPAGPGEQKGEEIAIQETAGEDLPPVQSGEAREYIPPADTEKKPEEEITLDAELLVESDEITSGTGVPKKPFEESIFAEAKEYVPPVAEGAGQSAESPAEKELGGAFMEQPEQEAARQKAPYTDFEPREYIPPTAALREERTEKVPAEAGPQGMGRKDTIDRLEHWLKNIKKET